MIDRIQTSPASTPETLLPPSPRDYSSLPQFKVPCLGSLPCLPPLVSCQPAGVIIPPQPIAVQPSLAPPSTFRKDVAKRSLCTWLRSFEGHVFVPTCTIVSCISVTKHVSFISGKLAHSPSCPSNHTASLVPPFLRVH